MGVRGERREQHRRRDQKFAPSVHQITCWRGGQQGHLRSCRIRASCVASASSEFLGGELVPGSRKSGVADQPGREWDRMRVRFCAQVQQKKCPSRHSEHGARITMEPPNRQPRARACCLRREALRSLPESPRRLQRAWRGYALSLPMVVARRSAASRGERLRVQIAAAFARRTWWAGRRRRRYVRKIRTIG